MANTSIKVENTQLLLKITFGIIPIVTGLDKFFYILTDWSKYISPTVKDLLPFSPATFMIIVGIIEIIVGLLVLTMWTRVGAYILTVWLLLIALNLIIAGFYDIALRDIGLSMGALALARLSPNS